MNNHSRIPLWLKLLYTAYLCVLVPVYWWNYGPQNFLFFCDVALFVTLLALWFENAFLASSQAVAILLPQFVWVADFLICLISGVSPTGFTGYMFDSTRSVFLRGLSTFHGWLPILLLWMVWRLGYDRRGFLAQILICSAVLIASYLLTQPPPPPPDQPHMAVNVNYVFGFPETKVQTTLPPLLWLAVIMAFHPVCIYLPTHLVLRKLLPDARSKLAKNADDAAAKPEVS